METYKIIEGFENYSVSDFGNVRNNETVRILKKTITSDGYIRISLKLNKVEYKKRVHILVANAFIANPDGKACVDHIDNIKSNNHINNLRWATSAENQHNRSVNINNKSGCKGVSWHKGNKKWQSQIMIDGINVHLGYFPSLEDAKQARITRANHAFGVCTNACEKII